MSRSEKIRGFMAAAEAAGLARCARDRRQHASTEYGDSEMADVGRLLAARIAADRKRPTGVVAVNDMLAFGLLAGLRDAGLAVPDDVSVIGMDGLFLSSLTSPGLTTVRLPVPGDGAHDRRACDRPHGRPGHRAGRVPVRARAGRARVGGAAAGAAATRR